MVSNSGRRRAGYEPPRRGPCPSERSRDQVSDSMRSAGNAIFDAHSSSRRQRTALPHRGHGPSPGRSAGAVASDCQRRRRERDDPTDSFAAARTRRGDFNMLGFLLFVFRRLRAGHSSR